MIWPVYADMYRKLQLSLVKAVAAYSLFGPKIKKHIQQYPVRPALEEVCQYKKDENFVYGIWQ